MAKMNFKSLNFKLITLVFAAVAPLVFGVLFYVLPIFENHLLEQRKQEVKTAVTLTIGVMEKIRLDGETNHTDKKLVAAEMQALFARLRYNKTDYFFAYDEKGYNMAHGTKPEYVGTDRASSVDPNGVFFVKEFLKFIGKTEGGFVPYKFEKTAGKPLVDKVSYIEFYPQMNWIVGSGVYMDEVQQEVGGVRNKILIGLGVILTAVFCFTWLFSNRLCNQIDKISSDLFNEANNVAEVATNISKASENLSESTNQQASALQQTSASVEQTSAMISKNADNAKSSMQISTKSQASVEEGKKIINEMISSIHEISEGNAEMVKKIDESNQEIGEIVKVIKEIGDKTKVINDIVFQTKLLSFNASVEAARAGEHGKGFAVVAEEIGNLAQMSGNSAKEISELLATSIATVQNTIDKSKTTISVLVSQGENKVNQSAEIAQSCQKIFDQIVVNVNQVNVMVGEIASASHEQATGIKEINSAVGHLDASGQQNNVMSKQTADYADQLQSQVEALRKNTSSLGYIISGKKAA